MTEAASEAPVAAPAADLPPIPVRCRETGFRARIPAADWDAYTPEQRGAYERLDAPEAAQAEPAAAKPRKIKEG